MHSNSFYRFRGCRPVLLGAYSLISVAALTAQPLPNPPAAAKPTPPAVATKTDDLASKLSWDATTKSYEAKPGEATAAFEFRVTNKADAVIAIQTIATSCGCTAAELPPLPAAPYQLAAGATAPIRVVMDLKGKAGLISKSVTVGTSVGSALLTIQVNIPAAAVPTVAASGMGADRAKNLEIATHDRQAILKGDCAKCHATPAAGKMGQDLYGAVCTICHEANPRAAMIPDLHVARGPRDLAFWTKWISEGGPGTMMPGFSTKQGGPLDDDQVASLAMYLFAVFSHPANSK